MGTSVAESNPISAPAMTLPVALQRLTQQRDPQAWEALLHHSGDDILRISRRILGDAALAEDACQETLLQIRAHAGVFKLPVSPKEAQQAARIWIMRLATNIALRMGRGRIRSQKRDVRSAENSNRVDANCPESNTLRGEQSAILQREVADLPETLREPILLRFYAEMDYPALGQALACSPDAAKKRVQRGLDRLRVRLALLGLLFTLGDLSKLLLGTASAHAAEAAHALGAAGAITLAAASTSASAGASGAVAVHSAQHLAWSALLNSSSAPALSSAVQLGGLSLMVKISLGVAALLLVGTSVAVVQHSIAAEKSSAPATGAAANTTAASAPATPAAAVSPEEPWKAELRQQLKLKVSFDFQVVPFDDAVKFLGSISKINLVISPKLTLGGGDKVPVTIKVKDMELGVALKTMTKLAGLDYTLKDQAVYIGPAETIAGFEAEKKYFVDQAVKAEKAALALRDQPWKKNIMDQLQRKISFDFQNTPLADGLRYLRQDAPINMIIEPKLAQEDPIITLRGKEMTTEMALTWVTKMCDAEWVLQDNAVYIRKAVAAAEEKGKVPSAAVKPPAPPEF